MVNKLNIVQSIFLITLLVISIAQQDDCYPRGIKLGLGDKWDKNRNYDSQKLSISVNHDYSISYFIKKECKGNSITIQQDQNVYLISPVETRLFSKTFEVQDLSGKKEEKNFQIYIQTYYVDLNNFKINENSYISYSVNYDSDSSSQLKRGPFTFFHHGQNKLLKSEFSLLWIADFDTKINKNGVNFGKDNFNKIISYFEKNKKEVVSILGGGDYAYDLDSNFGQVGFDFMEDTESLFSNLPFLPVAGNHESNFPVLDYAYFNSYYRTPHFQASNNERFTASFGRVLVIGLNNNHYLKVKSPKYGSKFPKILEFNQDKLQGHVTWLKQTIQDLKKDHDWVIVYSHMSMFCSSENDVECLENANQLQILQDAMAELKVDVYISGHTHAYERIHPNYNNEKRYSENSECGAKQCSVYDKPTAPVYIVDGSGGNAGEFSGLPQPYQNSIKFSVTSDQDAGFSVFSMTENNELLFQHYRSKNMEIIDSFTIKKDLERIEGDDDDERMNQGFLIGLIVMSIILGIALAIIIALFIKLKQNVIFTKQIIQTGKVQNFESGNILPQSDVLKDQP